MLNHRDVHRGGTSLSNFEHFFINPLISVCERARMDEEYRSKVMYDPMAVLRQVGCRIPSHLRVFVEELELVIQEKGDAKKKIAIPLTPIHRAGELTEQELGQVSAGTEQSFHHVLKYKLSLFDRQSSIFMSHLASQQ